MKAPSTFHRFMLWDPRPDGIRIEHLGWDNVHYQQRDGLPLTSENVPSGPWKNDINAPLVLTSDEGEVVHIIPPHSANNPGFDKEPVNDSLLKCVSRQS